MESWCCGGGSFNGARRLLPVVCCQPPPYVRKATPVFKETAAGSFSPDRWPKQHATEYHPHAAIDRNTRPTQVLRGSGWERVLVQYHVQLETVGADRAMPPVWEEKASRGRGMGNDGRPSSLQNNMCEGEVVCAPIPPRHEI